MTYSPWPVVAYAELDSTNAEACRRADAGEAGPLWIIAGRQSAGRGRRGRAWSSHPNNLSVTLLMRTERTPAQAALVSFVAALAVADLARTYVPDAVTALKWPNDLLLDGRKAAGLLVESGASPRGGLWLAIGFGVNLAWAPTDSERPSTSLADHLRPGQTAAPSPGTAYRRLDEVMQARLAQWDREGSASILSDWTERATGIPGPCAARLGRETLEGHAEGLEPDGALRLRLGDGSVRLITAGDVFFGASA